MRKPLLFAGLVLAILTLVAVTGRYPSDLESLGARMEDLRAWHMERPLAVVAAGFFAAYVVVTALSLPFAVWMTLAAGALFGFGTALVLVSFASTLGATLAFLTSRYLLRDWVHDRFGDRLRAIDDGIARDGAAYLFTLRLIPVVPFFAVNL